MIYLRRADTRGRTRTEWLDSFHTFSFGDYHDPAHHHFGSLRVINEDFVNPDSGFGLHPHRHMEIITYIISGELTHHDSMGNGSVITRGEIQRMSAGTGLMHSEWNHSKTNPVHLLQIWIQPNSLQINPSYEQKVIVPQKNEWILLASPTGGDHAVQIHQQASLYLGLLDANQTLDYQWESNHLGYLQLITGQIDLDGTILNPGDGAALDQESTTTIKSHTAAEFLLFDLER